MSSDIPEKTYTCQQCKTAILDDEPKRHCLFKGCPWFFHRTCYQAFLKWNRGLT